jgi:tetratricopeptide (TPR) repeat protein
LCPRSHGQQDKAIAEFREAIRLKEDYANANSNLGLSLQYKDQLDEVIAHYQQALRFNNDNAEAHCNLGLALLRQGRFAEALAALKRGHELGSLKPGWSYPSARWLHDCEKLLELESRLPQLLAGTARLAEARESLALAAICTYKLPAAAARWYTEAFAAEPGLASAVGQDPRYNAACVAALARCGEGEDAAQLDDAQRGRWRQQALVWLRAELGAWRELLDREPDRARPKVAQTMRHWQQDPDFKGVRGPDALVKLPQGEREDWQKLWADVAETLQGLLRRPLFPRRPLGDPPTNGYSFQRNRIPTADER